MAGRPPRASSECHTAAHHTQTCARSVIIFRPPVESRTRWCDVTFLSMKILTAAPTLLFQGPLIATAFTNGYHWAGGPVGISSEVLPFIYCAFLSVFPLLHLHHIMGCLFACLQTAAPHVDGRVYYQGKCGCSDVSGDARHREQWHTHPYAYVGTVFLPGGGLDTLFKLRIWISNPKFFTNKCFFWKFSDRSQLFFCRSDAGTCPFLILHQFLSSMLLLIWHLRP